MAKTTENSRLLAVVVLLLLMVGVGLYFIPRFAQVINGETVDWSVISKNENAILSSFEEQSYLQQVYADNIQRDIITALEKVVGVGAVQVTARVQLNLEKEQSSQTKMLKDMYSENVLYRTAGVVKNISVSVLVDGQMEKRQNGRTVYQPRSKDEMKKFETLVEGIIGYQAARGDKIEVLNMPFTERQFSWGGISGTVLANAILLIVSFLCFWGFIVACILPLMKGLTRSTIQEYSKYEVLKKAISLCRQDMPRAVCIFKNALRQSSERKNPRVYTVSEQAAIVLLSLGDYLVREIFSALSEEEVRRYGKIMCRLGQISASDIRYALEQFIRQFYTPSNLVGSPDRVKDVLMATRRDGKNIYSEICLTADGKNIWERLSGLDKGLLTSFLKEQKTETIALVLYHLPEELSGRILTLLPKELASRVLIHLRHIPYIRSDVREKLIGEIATDLLQLLEQGRQVDKTADILKTMTRKEQDEMVSEMAKKDENMARQMTSSLKDWTDVLGLSEQNRKILLKYVDKNVLAMALVDGTEAEQMVFARLLPPAVWEQITTLIQKYVGQNSQPARDIILKTAIELKLF